MADIFELWEKPQANELYLIAGWRQWADAGSISSGLPQYLVQHTQARQIGVLHPDSFYLFQFPGTHDWIRPVVKFVDGYPESLVTQRNEFHYTGNDQRGVVIFLGDEPHLNIERYVGAVLKAAQSLGVKRIIGLGGVYGEIPFDKERPVSCNYSLPGMKEEMLTLSVDLSNYHGGASIGSYICKRSGEIELEYAGLYGFVPSYDFSNITQIGSSIRIENDFTAWLGIMRRIKSMLKYNFDLSELERKSKQLTTAINTKIEELENQAPQSGIRDYLNRLTDEFTETTFNPLDDIWEEELRRILGKFDDETDNV